jgi:hypothetical protein
MGLFVKLSDVTPIRENGHLSYEMLNETNGCVAGCCTGISIYPETEYSVTSCHDDQEGFLILEGFGLAKVGEAEFAIEPELSFIVPAGIHHYIKRDPASKPVKVFWFHSTLSE